MNEQTKNIIEQYFDKELPKSKEPQLFELLANDEAARNYFKIMYEIKNSSEEIIEDYPNQLDKKILNTLYEKTAKQNFAMPGFKFSYLFAYSFAIVMLVVSILFYYDLRSYQYRLDQSIEQINYKQKEVELLLNSIPSIQVNAVELKHTATKTNL
jgi:hypothetical protein